MNKAKLSVAVAQLHGDNRLFKTEVDGKTIIAKGTEITKINRERTEIVKVREIGRKYAKELLKNEGIEIFTDFDSPQSRGHYKAELDRWVGGCWYKDLNNTRILIRECLYCGKEFETSDRRKKYCSDRCRWRDLSARRKNNRLCNRTEQNLLLECPICHARYSPKTKRSPTCGKVRCRKAWSRLQAKSGDV
jgi:hypothetical protein